MNREMRDHQEVEWQFDALDVRPVSRWLQRDPHGRNPYVASGQRRELSDGYFDTEDWRIYRAGYALRIRREGDEEGAEATMKLLVSKNGKKALKSRREISEPLDSASPEVLSDAPGPVGDRVRALTGPKALHALFEVQTSRTTHGLVLDGLRAGEISLDETAIPIEEEAEPVSIQLFSADG